MTTASGRIGPEALQVPLAGGTGDLVEHRLDLLRPIPLAADRASSSADQEPMSDHPADSGTTAIRPSAAAGSAMPVSIAIASIGSMALRTSVIQPGVRCSASTRSIAD